MPEFDALTIVAAAIAWSLTALFKKFAADRLPKVKHLLPGVALLFAVGIVTGVGVYQGGEVTLELVWEGVLAGCIAIAGHSQFREILKGFIEVAGEDKPDDAETDPGDGSS